MVFTKTKIDVDTFFTRRWPVEAETCSEVTDEKKSCDCGLHIVYVNNATGCTLQR
jgi:hypothetical protein